MFSSRRLVCTNDPAGYERQFDEVFVLTYRIRVDLVVTEPFFIKRGIFKGVFYGITHPLVNEGVQISPWKTFDTIIEE